MPFIHIGLFIVDDSVAVPIGDGLVFLKTQEEYIFNTLVRPSMSFIYSSEVYKETN